MTTSYEITRAEIFDGDVLLWRPAGFFGWLICSSSGSKHSHVGIAGWVRLPDNTRRLMSLETVEGAGGTITPLSELVAKYPGRIDVYEANAGDRWPEFNRQGVVAKFFDNVLGKEYGRWAAIKAGLRKVCLLRLFLRPNYNDAHRSDREPFCSGAVSRWTRVGGGVDPVLERADDSTWPGDLETSPFYQLKHEGLVP